MRGGAYRFFGGGGESTHFLSVGRPRPGVVSSSGGLARGSRHARHRRPRAEMRGRGCLQGSAQACGGGARGDTFSLGPWAGAGHPWCVSLRGGCACGGGVGGGTYARRACRRVGSVLSAPRRLPPMHPPLLRGNVTPPPAPSSLMRLPVVRELFLRALFFAAAAPSTAAGSRRLWARACARF